jgi:hypothetical protein
MFVGSRLRRGRWSIKIAVYVLFAIGYQFGEIIGLPDQKDLDQGYWSLYHRLAALVDSHIGLNIHQIWSQIQRHKKKSESPKPTRFIGIGVGKQINDAIK